MYNVSYFDSLNGGSGMVRVKKEDLETWLREHKGHLIYRLDPL